MTETKDDQDRKPDEDDAAKALRVEQDSRVARQKAEAETKGGGATKPEDGLNQDG